MSAYGVYVHVPWCRSVCPYCAFNVRADADPPSGPYVDALLRQWEAVAGAFGGPPTTLYLGGGTPSLMRPGDLARLVQAIRPTQGVEMEANPEDVDAARLEAWQALGVRRLSLGVQTFSPRHARLLKRAHSVSMAREVLARVAASGLPTWSVDLIFGLPGQTPAELAEDLDALLDAGAPHASLYSLTVEPGTPLARAVAAGRLTPADDDAWAELFELAAERLPGAGLARYEVSNFARPGHESAHNEHYWRGRPYAGLGAGAHGLLPDGRRTVSEPDPAAYMADPLAGVEVEVPTPRERAVDLLLSTLRHRDGVPEDRLAALGFGFDAAGPARLRAQGLLAADGVRLQGRGWALETAALRALEASMIPVISSETGPVAP